MDNNHRIFFASNYDGSHESYMDDFINKVGWCSILPSLMVSATPPPGGSSRKAQTGSMPSNIRKGDIKIPTEVWYKAYPGLTAVDSSCVTVVSGKAWKFDNPMMRNLNGSA